MEFKFDGNHEFPFSQSGRQSRHRDLEVVDFSSAATAMGGLQLSLEYIASIDKINHYLMGNREVKKVEALPFQQLASSQYPMEVGAPARDLPRGRERCYSDQQDMLHRQEPQFGQDPRMIKQRSIIHEESIDSRSQHYLNQSERSTVNYGGVEYMFQGAEAPGKPSLEESSINIDDQSQNNMFLNNIKQQLAGNGLKFRYTLNENYINDVLSCRSRTSTNNISSQGKNVASDSDKLNHGNSTNRRNERFMSGHNPETIRRFGNTNLGGNIKNSQSFNNLLAPGENKIID